MGDVADVVIVGGGPAGLTAALTIAHVDRELLRRTIVLEKESYPRDKICAGAVAGRALARLSALGALPDVPHVEIRGVAATTRFGTLVQRSPHTVGWVVRRLELDAALARIARERGVDLRERSVVSEVLQNRGEDPVVVLADGSRIQARVVIGADGVGSVVRRGLRLGRGPVVAQAVELDTERAAQDLPGDVIHFDLMAADLRGYAWDFPTPLAGKTRMSRGVYDLGPRAQDPTARLRARTRLVPLGPPRRFSERGFTVGSAISRGRVLLIGEAAGIDPVLGEGIAQAIFYGEAAGRYVSCKLGRGEPWFEDYASALWRGRLGLDLGVRARAVDWVYGDTRRPVERAITSSQALARAGLSYFRGEHVSRFDLARAAIDVARSGVGSIFR